MSVSNIQIRDYINSLNLEPGSNNYNLFNKLILIDYIKYKEILEKLVLNEIIIEDGKLIFEYDIDGQTLKRIELDEISDNTIDNFLYQINNGGFHFTKRRKETLDMFKDPLQFNFNTFKQEILNNFNLYLYKRFISAENYLVKVQIDSTNLSSNVFESFHHVKNKYIELVGFYEEDDLILNNEELQLKYDAFLDFHNRTHLNENYPSMGNRPVINLLNEILLLAFKEPIFIQSTYNVYKITNYPLYMYLLNEIYKYIPPVDFNKIYTLLVDRIVQKYDHTKGWSSLQELVNESSWNDLSLINNKSNISEEFSKLKMIRYYYPKLYKDKSNFFNDLFIDIDEELKFITYMNDYFTSAKEVLDKIVDILKNNFDN